MSLAQVARQHLRTRFTTLQSVHEHKDLRCTARFRQTSSDELPQSDPLLFILANRVNKRLRNLAINVFDQVLLFRQQTGRTAHLQSRNEARLSEYLAALRNRLQQHRQQASNNQHGDS